MSATTKQALEDALRAHIADEHDPDAVVTEWIIVAAGVTPGIDADARDIWYEDSDMPVHHHTGLLRHHLRRVEHAVVNHEH